MSGPMKVTQESVTLPPGPVWLSVLVAVVAAACMVVLVEHIYRIEQDRALQSQRNASIQLAATVRALIEAELSASLYAATGLVGYVAAHEDFLDAERVSAALEAIHRHGRHLRNVALAPDNVLSHVYPLAGNEAVVGFDYRTNAEQWPDVERVMRERSSILVGPVNLVQGGRGLINRTPVFLLDGRYWGLLSVVIDPDSLFGYIAHEAPEDVRFAVRWHNREQQENTLVAGDPSVFAEDAVRLDVPVPGGQWELGVVSRAPLDPGRGYLGWYRAGGHLMSLALAFLLMMVLRERWVIARMALTDQLTGLPNRRALQHQLSRNMRIASRRGESFALVYIDLDGFKAINDRSGHSVGDRVLVTMTQRMRQALGDSQSLARIGGDEFVLLLPGAADKASALAQVQPLLHKIRKPIDGLDSDLSLDATVGVAIFPGDGSSTEALISAADARMYEAKGRVSYSRSVPRNR
ncbi:MAG: sensor domain-containing diguanylate cyclase [Wenzhouxiangella sp.]|nr:MAG: sensor domain-containing diguanylate cyclase [Wenzhouxiangella sp.]